MKDRCQTAKWRQKKRGRHCCRPLPFKAVLSYLVLGKHPRVAGVETCAEVGFFGRRSIAAGVPGLHVLDFGRTGLCGLGHDRTLFCVHVHSELDFFVHRLDRRAQLVAVRGDAVLGARERVVELILGHVAVDDLCRLLRRLVVRPGLGDAGVGADVRVSVKCVLHLGKLPVLDCGGDLRDDVVLHEHVDGVPWRGRDVEELRAGHVLVVVRDQLVQVLTEVDVDQRTDRVRLAVDVHEVFDFDIFVGSGHRTPVLRAAFVLVVGGIAAFVEQHFAVLVGVLGDQPGGLAERDRHRGIDRPPINGVDGVVYGFWRGAAREQHHRCGQGRDDAIQSAHVLHFDHSLETLGA
jgi:hypothetical protein